MIRVLCADDESILLNELEENVRAVLPGAEILSSDDSAKLLEMSCREPVDIAFLDINMGTVDGVTVAKNLQKTNPKINIIFCTGYSEYALDALNINCSGYLMKPISEDAVRKAVDTVRYSLPDSEDDKIKVRCFGNFDISYRGKPLKFKYNKTKELVAYLIDRKGAEVSKNEVSAILFEDDEHDAYLSKLRKDLIDTTEMLHVDLIRTRKGYVAINRDAVTCDYYDYLDGDEAAADKFRGEYMAQYSWAEETLAELY
ncbi:MAG: response regulator [Clostridiales bacterium]|nr:response regulator [Candidatus Crickella caballi]